MFTIKSLKANYGDCFLIRFGEGDQISNVLVDGGITRTYNSELKNEIRSIIESGQSIDLLVVTHIHDDHLQGIVKLFSDNDIDKSLIKKVWFNSNKLLSRYIEDLVPNEVNLYDNESREMGVNKANTLERSLDRLGLLSDSLVQRSKQYMNLSINGAFITVLTPNSDGLEGLKVEFDEERQMAGAMHDYEISLDKISLFNFEEDNSVLNRSSISFILDYNGKKIMMLGDAFPSDVIYALKRLGYSEKNQLKVDVIKLSHHASKKNTSIKLLNLIDCSRYIVSTDGSKRGMPSKECLGRIIRSKKNVELLFNYNIYGEMFSKEEYLQYEFECKYILNNVEV
ncbi:hypothetical protein QFZ77_005172 [Paenibacillus sp. V4I3]|uniref:ComEC/Rec2 family competence protein n=1 Tax=Paenibacillus sp. V4I3 TaxID=3042305 RepID=UPI00278A59EE|nr:MBL fold metallo-hydrolase [Paenibacillus sp. V4I3]MDQ0876513.1 hypothetical protein [Paenibacillus sp. V4I3]